MKRLLITLFLFLPFSLHAYNFLYIHPTTGKPIGWQPGTTIKYYLDPGKLGRLTNEQAHTLLKEAMKIWENASPYANVPHFEFAGYLPEDVDGTNYQKYVSLGQCYEDDLSQCESEAQKNLQTVIVFDEDSSILQNVLCKIGGCAATSGAKVFGGSSSNPGNIVQGIAVFRVGNTPGNDSLGSEVYFALGVMTHEIGHLLGLAHTVVNQEIANDADKSYFPTMMSIIFPDNSRLGEKDQMTLAPDDIVGISNLYPSNTFSQNTGTIKGKILKSDGTPMMHVNVIARNIEDPLCEAYSFLSGRVCPVNTHSLTLNMDSCFDNNGSGLVESGNFSFSSLPAGAYTLEVEEVANTQLAQTLAPGLFDEFIFGDAEFWNENDIANESNTLSSTITLAAGETKDNINIILNRNSVTDDRIKYIPLSTFTRGLGTQCQPTSKNYATLLGVSEPSDTSGNTSGGNPIVHERITPGGCSLIELHKQNTWP